MQFWTAAEMAEHEFMDHVPGEALFPGVVIERRTVLRGALQLAGVALVGGLTGLSGCASTSAEPAASASLPERLDASAFLARVWPRARQLIAAESESTRAAEEAYLDYVISQLALLDAPAAWREREPRGGFAMDTLAFVPPVVLYQIRMEPGAVIELHDHRHYNGALICAEGSAQCRNFDIHQAVESRGDAAPLDIAAGEVPPKGAPFLIRETRDAVLRPGDLSTLARDRDNIHEVTAGDDGCRLLDVFTHYRPEARSYAIEWDRQPHDADAGLYSVAWK